MSTSRPSSESFDHLLTQLSEFIDPFIVSGFMDEVEQMHKEGRDRAYVLSKLTEWVEAILSADDLL